MPAVNPRTFVELARLTGASGNESPREISPVSVPRRQPAGQSHCCSAIAFVRAAALLVLTNWVGVAHASGGTIDLSHQKIGAPPREFLFWRAGRVDFGHWALVADAASLGGTAIQRLDTDRTVQTALAVYTPLSALNARIRARFKLIDGSMPSAGIALRVTSPDDYYLVRASAYEQRVSVLHIVRGEAKEIAGVDAEIARDHWQTLEVSARDNGFTIWLDDQWVLTAFDYSRLAGGQFGIWTERDDVTRFNQIEISPLVSDYERSDLPGRFGAETSGRGRNDAGTY
jgi:hypothetical protein